MLLAIFVSMMGMIMCSPAPIVPHDFSIPLLRQVSDLVVEGLLQSTGFHRIGVDTVRRVSIRSSNCGSPVPQSRFRFTGTVINGAHTESVNLDVIDMRPRSPEYKSICIGFTGRLGEHIDSLIYTSTDSGESIILSPQDPERYAFERHIFYAAIHREQMVYASMSISDEPDQMTRHPRFTLMSLHVNQRDRSIIAPHIYDRLARRLRDLGASLILGGPDGDIRFDNCYERLVPVLPDIVYRFAHDAGGDFVSGELVFSPADYLEPRSDPHGCNIHFSRGRECESITLMDDLLRKVGGIHFDYRNNRIGFFDPL